MVRSDRESRVKTLQERLRIEPVPNSNMIEFRFQNEDPEVAARCTNTLAEVYRQVEFDGRQRQGRMAQPEHLTQDLRRAGQIAFGGRQIASGAGRVKDGTHNG